MGVVAKQASRAGIAVGFGIVLGAVNTIYVLPRAFEGAEAQWGLIRVLTAWGTILGQLTSFGMPSAILRFLPKYSLDERPTLLTMMLLIPIALLTLAGLVLFVWGKNLMPLLDGGENGLLTSHLGLFFVMTVLISGVIFTRAMVNSLLKSSVAAGVEEMWLKGTYLLLAVLLLNDVLAFETFLKLYVGTYAIGVAVIASQAWKSGMRLGWKRPEWHKWREIMGFGFYSLLSMSAVVIATNLDYVMVGYYLGLEAVPLYTMGFFIGQVVAMPVRSTAMIFNGLTADKVAKSDPSTLSPLLKESARTQLLMSVAVMAGIWAGFQPFEQILPPAYRDLEWVFLAIGLQRVVLASTGVTNNILGFSQHYKLVLPINIGLLVVTVFSNHLFMKVMGWGLGGAAFATMLTAVWNNGWRTLVLYRKFRIHPFTGSWLIIAGLALGCAWAFHWPAGWLGNPFVEAVLQGGLATGTIVATSILLGLVPEVEKIVVAKLPWWPRMGR